MCSHVNTTLVQEATVDNLAQNMALNVAVLRQIELPRLSDTWRIPDDQYGDIFGFYSIKFCCFCRPLFLCLFALCDLHYKKSFQGFSYLFEYSNHQILSITPNSSEVTTGSTGGYYFSS